ncbi:AAA family ATPase [Butyrivibrio sp. LC3010]|uniref:AAA family ATPase n=1 Tax=Butyrivibrio sp. LC3010 TaxID=1280680 RepID=UPI00041E1C86|nr:AAA family ATPase [Butyrivibrio sp. LC3010]
MFFYQMVIAYDSSDVPFVDEERRLSYTKGSTEEKSDFYDKIKSINNDFATDKSLTDVHIFFYSATNGNLFAVVSADSIKTSNRAIKIHVIEYINKHFDVANLHIEKMREIPVSDFNQLLFLADRKDLIASQYDIKKEIGTDYFDNNSYKIKEIMTDGKRLSYKDALEQAANIIADKSLLQELERIYSDLNEKKYYGNPVHYKIEAANMDAAMDIAELLTKALATNKRLPGSRITKIYDIGENCYDEDDVANIIKNAQGGVIILDMSGTEEDHGNYASAYHDVVDFFISQIQKYQLNTLFIFLEISSHPGFSKPMISKATEDISIVEIKEGTAKKKEIYSFIKSAAKKKKISVTDEDIANVLTAQDEYTSGEAYCAVDKLYHDSLKNTRYKAYKAVSMVSVEKSEKKTEPYKELSAMIGLKEVKKVVDNIIDSAKIRKLRSKMGMDNYKPSMHMVFTGNPGTAKTTVARLLSQILYKEEVIGSAKLTECGRADLIAKYVGWTAKTVRSKFREAKGGVLFIDEAYSLVDDENSFGDEAINTIVQEMENHRDDVIVIFAGYPEKMKAFLDKNEGLRSRIAFHVDFPDYNPDELCQIFDLMAKKKGYIVDEAVKQKCLSIMETASKKPEFGNGRFVRNLLEQAEMAQAGRILKEYNGQDINSEVLKVLKPEDFNVNASKVGKELTKIGFGA